MTVDSTVLTTCPRDCYDACGIEVAVRDGAVRHVMGDRSHSVSRGKLCRKCAAGYNGVFLDSDVRLTEPLLRDGPKGKGGWRVAGWEEAIAVVAGRVAAGGAPPPGAIFNAPYTGTSR